MKTGSRLSIDERRQAILTAARQVFAQRGFHGTTTKQLAEAAGVSEALIFRHFPSKKSLYAEIKNACDVTVDWEEMARLGNLPPSAATLVTMLHFMIWNLLTNHSKRAGDDHKHLNRLMLHSIMEDGEFARLFIKDIESRWISKLAECIAGAEAEGTLEAGPSPPLLRARLAHGMAVILMIQHLPKRPVIDYRLKSRELVEQAVWFSLRGLGMSDDNIRKFYHPEAIAQILRTQGQVLRTQGKSPVENLPEVTSRQRASKRRTTNNKTPRPPRRAR